MRGGELNTGVRWWIKWCVFGRRVSPIQRLDPSCPMWQKLEAELLLMDFANWLVVCRPSGRHISPESARKYVSQACAWHRRKFGYEIGAGLEFQRLPAMITGMRRKLDAPPKRQRFGVRTQDLRRALRRCFACADGAAPSALGAGLAEARNWRAACTTGFCGLLRAAEFALQPGEQWDGAQHLTRADVTFRRRHDGTVLATIMIKPCKSMTVLRGKTVPLILASGGALLDPVEELLALYSDDPVPRAEWATTPLFRGADGSAITVPRVRGMVRLLMGSVGLDGARFGAHSLRIGGASAMLAAGVDPTLIRLMGRWSSDVYQIYCRMSREAAARAAVLAGSTPFEELERAFQTEELELLPGEVDQGGGF